MASTPMATNESRKSPILRCRFARVMTVVYIVLTAALSLAWSHAKLLSQDEMYAFQTDSVPTIAQLIHVQSTTPISLDPLLDHLLSHLSMSVFGANAFASRLPALLGFLLMQICLFFFVRNLAGDRAGFVAAIFPALTATLYYSAEGRPYGLLLGLYALALLSWQIATRRNSHRAGSRALALIGLAVALAATINAHYFGILLLVPICAAEAWRTLTRRRPSPVIDWPVAAAIVIGMSSILATRPFLKAAGEFRKNYYNGGAVGLHDITRAYRSIFLDYTKLSLPTQHIVAALLVVFAAALTWGIVRRLRSHDLPISPAEWVALFTLAALPFCGYLLARFVTHSIEVRYVLGAVVALSALIAIAATPRLRRDVVFTAVVAMLGLALLGVNIPRIRAEQHISAARLAANDLSPAIRSALDRSADGRLYIQDMGIFEEQRYYVADPGLQRRITLVYSPSEELRWNRHDTMALTAQHLKSFTDLPIVSYETLRATPGEHVFILNHSGWDWTDQAFAEDGAHVTPLGPAMTGNAAIVRFH